MTNQIDSAHGGTLRHVGGVSHVKKWLATEKTVRALLPPVWGGQRTQATSAFKQAVVKRQAKTRMDQVVAAATATTGPLGSPAPGATVTPTTPATAGAVMGAAAAAAANLAAM